MRHLLVTKDAHGRVAAATNGYLHISPVRPDLSSNCYGGRVVDPLRT